MTPFSNLSDYLAISAVTALSLSPDGGWLAATVQQLDPEKKKFTTSIWRIDTDGGSPIRLTRSVEGESSPAFLPDGSVLFISKRPDPAAKQQEAPSDAKPALWLLPRLGGEARQIVAPSGGVNALVTARQSQSYLLAAPAFRGANGTEQDAARRKARAEAGVTAILHENSLVRYWDHDLGPDDVRLLAGLAIVADGRDADTDVTNAHADVANAVAGATRDLTPDPGRALDEQVFALSPDGSAAVTGWLVPEAAGGIRAEIAVIDVQTAERRTLLADPECDFAEPAVSPDGRLVVAIRSERDTYERPGDVTLVAARLDDNSATAGQDLLPGFDRRPAGAVWAPDSKSIYFAVDDQGRRPLFVVEVESGEVRQLTTDDAAYVNICPAPDGKTVYALRSSISEPPTPVRIDVTGPHGTAGVDAVGAFGADPVRLASPGTPIDVPGRVEEVKATAADGAMIRGWLVLPDGASDAAKAPLLLWVHGGPMMSWNAWSWRWNPWLMAARGYAVLLPDPALSTGYGQNFIARGHGTWGAAPYTDVMAITDEVIARPEIDASRIAMMGGSFGGYMANWIAGHTDRFAAIVSHAGLWALDQMFGTTDEPFYWRRMFGDPTSEPERYIANSPHRFVDEIVTPLLIIHGDKDYRVPIGEALRMHADLTSRGKNAKFLYFPDENHWILKPGDVRVWYETIFAFLAEHVLGEEWKRPELL